MNPIALLEYLCAAFVGITLLGQISRKDKKRCNKWLRLSLLALFIYLLIDASAYVFIGPVYPLAFRYILNLLAFSGAPAVFIIFIKYCEEYIKEKTTINPWTLRIPRLILAINVIAIAINFFAGNLVVYQNGIEVAVNNYPVYLRIISLIPMIYTPIVVISKRKSIGVRAVILLGIYNIVPIIATIQAIITGYDIGNIFGSFALVLVSLLLQRNEMNEEIKKSSQMQELSDGLAREYHTVWLMDGFGKHNLHLYRSTGKTTVQRAVQLGLDEPCFDTSIVKYIRDNVLEEDQERVIEETKFETIARMTSEVGTYVVTYRRYTENRKDYTYHQMCFARTAGEDGKTNYILAYRDADDMMKEEIAQQKQLRDALNNARLEEQRSEMIYEIAGASNWSYEINADGILTGAYYGKRATSQVVPDNKNPMEWADLLHPDDREHAVEEFMATVNDRSGKTPYETIYRIKFTDGDYHWVKSSGRVINHDDGTAELFGMSVDISSQIEEQEKRDAEKSEIERLQMREQELMHAEFRASALAFFTEHESDITSFLEFFAERLRNLVKCDQVIYRDDDGNRYLYNAPELGDCYEIAEDTCLNCPHSDMHSPLYASGVTEMEDTAIGVDGVPVNKACPVKSALTRTVQLDGNVRGYLAIHYILDYHEFTDRERRTLEEFANLLSLSLSRFAARTENTRLEEELELKAQVEEQKVQLEEQQKQLEKALTMAEVANKAKTDFLFNMSHDIRTPMNAIIGFTNIAKKEINNTEKALDSLNKVQLSSEILLNLINDVLDMSRIESGKAELHEEKYEMSEVFDTFEPAMASLAAAKDIDLKFSIENIRDNYVFADGPRFDRVLINIISNAIKYTPAEGFVNVTADQIDDTKQGYGNYRFTVADSGIGMSEEFQKHMFEDFTREENSTTSGIQGTGLGLSLAKKLVDMMGGTISCVSSIGVGTTFTIIFSFRLQTEEDRESDVIVAQEIIDVNLKGKRALLVEDNELNREIAGEILSDEGIIVDTAEDGQKAVNIVREHGNNYYDFILMDIQMPVMNGYEATRTIRKLMPELKTPIIALSANAFAEDKRKSIEAGMDDHVAKPINIKELMGVLAKVL